MRLLVANLGSTSFKYRLFEMGEREGGETLLAKGGYERVTDQGEAIRQALAQLERDGHLGNGQGLDAVGFKAVLGKDLTGCVPADDRAIAALEDYRELAPAHNPVYANGIRQFRQILPGTFLAALFETAFYQWVPEAGRHYAVPRSWYEAGVRRYGFHGASHKFIAERTAELAGRPDVAERVRGLYSAGPGSEPAGRPLRVISCHLGGSSSVTGIRNGLAIGTSMGLSPQSGVPQNNRVGDLDTMAIPFAQRAMGLSLTEVERQLSKEGGLLGLSGVGNDIRDIRAAALAGNARAQLALDVFAHEVRRWAGSFLFQMGGVDVISFTGGIGEWNPFFRAAVCEGLGELGVELDPMRNEAVKGIEGEVSSSQSRVRVVVIPANEELVVARETRRLFDRTKA